jgi:hypothetical protein
MVRCSPILRDTYVFFIVIALFHRHPRLPEGPNSWAGFGKIVFHLLLLPMFPDPLGNQMFFPQISTRILRVSPGQLAIFVSTDVVG